MIKVQTWYLYWCKDIKKSEKCVTATYMSSKKAKCCSSEVFAFHLIADIKSLAEHTKRIITQYRQIKGIKKLVADELRKSLHIRVDWSKKWKALSSHTTRRSILSQDSSFYQCCSCLHVFKCHISLHNIWYIVPWSTYCVGLLTTTEHLLCWPWGTSVYIISDSPTSQ